MLELFRLVLSYSAQVFNTILHFFRELEKFFHIFFTTKQMDTEYLLW